jgi:adenine phosphoribosyltransferase
MVSGMVASANETPYSQLFSIIGRQMRMDLTQYIRDIPDFPKPGILFKDITPLLANPQALQYAIERMAEHYPASTVDAVAAVEARGFLFAAPLALSLRKPLIPLRKPGKLPYQTHTLQYDLEYGSAELQIHIDAFTAGKRVLLVDDLLATGGTMAAGCRLVQKAGGTVMGCVFLVELAFLGGRDKLKPYEAFSLIRY